MPAKLNSYIKTATKTGLLVACVFTSTASMAKTYPMLYHIVEQNETLTSLSKEFGIDVDYIVELNGIKKRPLKKGQKILVPDIGKIKLNRGESLSKSQKQGVIKVTTVTPTMKRKVADSETKTKKAQVSNSKVASAQVQPKIDRKKLAKVSKGGNYDYTVQSGDTLSHIALDFGIKVTALQEFNSIDDGFLLQVGDLIVIPSKANRAKSSQSTKPSTKSKTPNSVKETKQPLKAKSTKKINYAVKDNTAKQHVVKSGDSLYAIAIANGVSQQALVEENNIQIQDVLNIGQVIKIPSKADAPKTVPKVVIKPASKTVSKAVTVLESLGTY